MIISKVFASFSALFILHQMAVADPIVFKRVSIPNASPTNIACAMKDGGYASVGFNSGELSITHFTADGIPLWSRWLFTGMRHVGLAVTQSLDGGLAITGYRELVNGEQDGFLAKIDSLGHLEFHKTFTGVGRDRFHAIIATPDSGFVLAGEGSFETENTHAVLLKTDKTGAVVWFHEYLDFAYSAIHAMKQDEAGALVLAGVASDTSASAGLDATLMKTDSVGRPLWIRKYSESGRDIANDLDFTEDGGYILAGSTTSFWNLDGDAALMKTDALGNLLWVKTIGNNNTEEVAYSVKAMDDGYVLWGAPISGEGRLMKRDSQGNFVWDKVLGNENEVKTSILQQAPGRMVVCATQCVTVLDDEYAFPIITRAPKSRFAFVGESETFAVQTFDVGPAYQWLKNGVLIPGANSATLTLASVTYADSGIYSVTVTNTRGTVTSEGAILSLRQPATNLARNGTATASEVWENNQSVRPSLAIDGSTYDAPRGGNYWVLPNETTGWWQVDLGQEFALGTIDIYNINNDGANDRGTQAFRLEILDASQAVVHSLADTLPFTSYSSASFPTTPYTLRLPSAVTGRYVKIYVDSWYPTRNNPFWPYPVIKSNNATNQGGGLNDVHVFGP